MKIAVTSHAVSRYKERVEGAKEFETESVRNIIRDLVSKGFSEGAIAPHPYEPDRRIIPFKSGDSILYLSIGPNNTTFDADIAVIGVLFEHDVTQGKIGVGVTIGDTAPNLKDMQDVISKPTNQFMVFIGSDESIEMYKVKDLRSMKTFMEWRKPERKNTYVYELRKDFFARFDDRWSDFW